MSTRLHALGFPTEWTPQMLALVESLAASQSRLVGAARGNYRLWRSRDGAELWFHYPQRTTRERAAPAPAPARANAAAPPPGRPLGSASRPMPASAPQPSIAPPAPAAGAAADLRPVAVTPFHRGLSSCQVKIGRWLTLDRVNPLEGSCMAWLPPPAGGGQEQVIVLELAPYGLQPMRTPPYTTTAQIVCFAHAVWAFKDTITYARETPGNRRIQAGSFSPVTETDVPEVKLSYRQSPITLGLATGTVRRTIRYINPETRQPYYWMLLETRRGTFDVIANPAQVQGDISEGNIAQVCGSFLARLAGTTF